MASSNTLTVGSTYRWQLTATLDGDVWDLSAATVTLKFHRPDGSTSEFAAVLVGGGTGGVARYDNDTLDLDVAGRWRRSWEVIDGDVVQRSVPQPFVVVDTP